MSRSIDIQKPRLKFPPVCAVCLAPAAQVFKLQRTLTYGRRSFTLWVPVPMCEPHLEKALRKSPAERLIGWLGTLGGLLAWAVTTGMLFSLWAGSGQGNLILNLFSAGFFGFGVFLIVWGSISYWLAPLFADGESKEARKAVQIKRYWPKDQYIRLEFQNEPLAEMVEKESQSA